MRKNTQIFLLGLVFVISGAAGYLIEGALLSDVNKQEEEVQEVVQPEVVLSPVPVVYVSEVTKISSGKYEFTASALTESGDTELKYVLYADTECTKEIAGNYDGKFTDIPAVESQTYYLKVWNIRANIWSEVVPVAGFIVQQEYKITKLTQAEVEAIIKDYSAASKDDINNRIAKGIKIECQGLAAEDRGVSTIGEVSSNLNLGIWSSVDVLSIGHDGVGRLNRLLIKVTY